MTDLLLLLDVDMIMMRLSSARMFSLPRLNWPDAM